MMIYLRIFLLLGLLGHFFAAQAQEISFTQLPKELGWSNHTFNDILQDHKGFIWLATWTGLARFDGSNMHVYRQDPTNSNGLKGNKIITLFEDSKNRLWVGTNYSGFYQYVREKDAFIQHIHDPNNPNSLSNNSVWAIEEDSVGNLWIGTENGLNKFDPETGRFLRYFQTDEKGKGLSHEFVYSLAFDDQNQLWIGTETGLNRMIQRGGDSPPLFFHYDLAPTDQSYDDYLRHNFIESICVSAIEENVIWVGTSIGLKKLSVFEDPEATPKVLEYYHPQNTGRQISHHFVSDIFESKEGNLWIATYNGLNKLNISTGEISPYFSSEESLQGLSNSVIKSIFKDSFGVLWVGTEKGMNRTFLKPNPFLQIPLKEDRNQISAIYPSGDRNGFWVSTHGGGLNFLDLYSKDFKHYPLEPLLVPGLAGFVSDILVDKSGRLWIPTQGAGVLVIPEKNIPEQGQTLRGMQQFTKENKLSDDYVMSVLESRTGEIWLGYWDKGLDCYNPKNGQFSHITHSPDLEVDFTKYPIVAMAETQKDDNTFLWLGTRGGGLIQMQLQNGKLIFKNHFKYEDGKKKNLSNNYISCLYEDKNHRLWIGTEAGLNQLDLDSGQIKYYLEKDGLSDPMVASVQQGDDGKIWIGTQNGLSSLDLSGEIPHIQSFDVYDGLFDNRFRTNAGAKTKKGELLFACSGGVNMFVPNRIKPDTIAPQISIIDLKIANESVSIGESYEGRVILPNNISEISHLALSYLENVISFEFIGIYSPEPQKVQYAYKLDGFDEEWVLSNFSNRIAHYTNLPYQEYTFMVKAANGDGIWSKPAVLSLTIDPPWWRTDYAYAFYVFCGILLIWIVLRISQIRAQFRHSLQIERMEKEKLQEVNDMKLQFFTNISHELRTPLTLIISPLEQLIKTKKTDKKLYQSFVRMHNNANRLLTMINQLLDIRKSESGLMKLRVAEGDIVKFIQEISFSFKGLARQKDISFKFRSKVDSIFLWFDRDQLEKVVFNLLSNAFKFTAAQGEIRMSLAHDEEQNAVLMKISDTGIGIPINQIEKIFDRFYQVEQPRKQSPNIGTGIGLALSKNIVEAHKGKIWVESVQGQGTTFFILLPKGDQHFAEDEKLVGFQNSESINQYLVSNVSEEGLLFEPQSGSTEATLQSDCRILVVEDNEDIRSYLKDNLSSTYQIIEAKDGIEGWEKAIDNPPDLVLADISMPGMDGIELCSKLKSNIHTSHIPVVLLTARTSLIFKIDGFENGADDYITKPFNMRLLSARISNLLESRLKLRKKFSKKPALKPEEITLHSLDETFLEDIRKVIEENLDNPEFTVETLAEGVNMSRMQLYRKLKALTGRSPIKVIRNFRLERAAQLLNSQQYNVAEVTYMVGYNDLKSFREQFKKNYGINPSLFSNG